MKGLEPLSLAGVGMKEYELLEDLISIVSGYSGMIVTIEMYTYAAEFCEKTVLPLKALGKVLAEAELEDVALLESEETETMRALVSSRGRSLFVILPELPGQLIAIGL